MYRLSPLSSIAALCALSVGLQWHAAAQKFHGAVSVNQLMSRADPVQLFDDRPDGCPPCFNCNLEDFVCHQFANCSASNGRCVCPPGFGGEDCSTPTCGSLADKERPPREGDRCECKDGWGGINCNVCLTDDACHPLVTGGAEVSPVCYKEGLVVKQNFQQCAVTNKKVVEMLKDKKPEVTFSCNAPIEQCNFQFWVDQREAFYCDLDDCSWNREVKTDSNVTSYHCESARCSCVPGRMLCGEPGSIDIGDFLGSIKGPADFKSTWKNGNETSVFSEPTMNDLISSVFADQSIFLSCYSGECMALTEVPGYEKPVKRINTPLIAGVISGCALFIVAVILLVWYLGRRTRAYDSVHLSDDEDDESAKLLADHQPANLQFQNVGYNLNGRQILSDIQGSVQPGELMAIMGASGAGKTTFLDILARKNKKGEVQGDFFINGEKILDSEFRSIIGFVDQEDTLLPTLTVHETIMDSAMLRLPKSMSLSAKRQKVEDVERQLGIHHIRHQIIGSEEGSGRGISGGEKRRVGIACELVTSPSILFLDEPTSGLDAYNAFNVVECLVSLVKNYNRTVVFTIHQPRSNIVALFDQLVLLAKGRVVYSGPFSSCQSYFDSIGYSCPPGFNIADYLVDLTMHAGRTETPMDEEILAASNSSLRGMASRTSSAIAVKSINVSQNDSEDNPSVTESLLRPKGARRTSIKHKQERQLFTRRKTGQDTASPRTSDVDSIPDSRASKLNGSLQARDSEDADSPLPGSLSTGTDLDILVSSYANSEVAKSMSDETTSSVRDAATANGGTFNGNGSLVPVAGKVKGYKKVGFLGQFMILSARTWKNLYRNPMLLLVHYAVAILLAVLVGFLFFSLTDDIKGFQNRLGLCFFLLALFGFSSLSGLTTFSTERLLFVKERSKGFYAPISYFTAKVLFDVIPLRLIPPMIMAAIIYPMTGLVPAWAEFWKFVLILVLFNLACAAICLCIGVLIKNGGLANLVGSLIMLFSLLLSGFLLNSETFPVFLHWLQLLSVFHFGFESLMVNEVRYLTLIDHKYGLDIEVPGASILSSFGFNVMNLWTDVIGLGIFAGVLIVAAYGFLHFLLVERR